MLKQNKIRFTRQDAALLMIIAITIGYLIYRIKIGLHYQWNWAAMPQYLIRYDNETGKWTANVLIKGLLTTIRLSIWATIMALFIGFVMGVFRVSTRLFRRMISKTYVELIRNTPPLVLIFIFYYFVSQQIMPVIGVDEFIRSRSDQTQAFLEILFAPPERFSQFISAVVTLAILESAYITEIVRSGIQSIPKEQWEASSALGFTRGQQLWHVIFPQAIQIMIPPLAGQLVSTIKDSAIVSIISVQELTFQGMELMAATYLTFECWITITVLYLLLTFSLSMLSSFIETQLRRKRHF